MPAWGIFKPKVRQSISGRSLKNKGYKFEKKSNLSFYRDYTPYSSKAHIF